MARQKTKKLPQGRTAESGEAGSKPPVRQVRFRYVFPDDYNPVYANGAYGGVTTQREIAIGFYVERYPVPNDETFPIGPVSTNSSDAIYRAWRSGLNPAVREVVRRLGIDG
jgi:hypothetical protein